MPALSDISEEDSNSSDVNVPEQDLWFDTGNVALMAEGTSFRVHMDVLSRLSEPWLQTFVPKNLTRGSSKLGIIQGCPVYYVPDSAYDMSIFLHAIYDGRRYLRDRAPEINFSELSALMRLGHQYGLEDIVADAASYLEDYYTPNFKTWLLRRSGPHKEKLRISESDDASGAVFEAVNLARLTNKPTILPLALYSCCQRSAHDLIHGVARPDSDSDSEEADPVRLAPADVVRCVSARDRLVRASGRTMAHIIHSAACAPDCAEPDMCAVHMARLRAAFEDMRVDISTADALAGFETQLGELADLPCWQQLCDECCGLLIGQHGVKRRETWDCLLDILDLSAEELGIEWGEE